MILGPGSGGHVFLHEEIQSREQSRWDLKYVQNTPSSEHCYLWILASITKTCAEHYRLNYLQAVLSHHPRNHQKFNSRLYLDQRVFFDLNILLRVRGSPWNYIRWKDMPKLDKTGGRLWRNSRQRGSLWWRDKIHLPSYYMSLRKLKKRFLHLV